MPPITVSSTLSDLITDLTNAAGTIQPGELDLDLVLLRAEVTTVVYTLKVIREIAPTDNEVKR